MSDTVYFHSDEVGAPTLTNANGSLIAILDACLLNGFNSKTLTSLVVSAGVATATASAHGYESGRKVLLGGSTPSGLNGVKEITVTGSNTFTFPAVGVSNGSATGTITCKRAPLGWTKQFTGSNKAVYARTDPAALPMVLRIDDTGAGAASATHARAVMGESATDVDTLIDISPTAAQMSGGRYWCKGVNTSTPKPWVLVGNERSFYFLSDNDNYPANSYQNGLYFQGFGDLCPLRTGDAYSSFLLGGYQPGSNYGQFVSGTPGAEHMSLARLSNGIDKAPYACMTTLPSSSTSGAVGGYGPVYPSPVNNGMLISNRAFVIEQNPSFTHPFRGWLPGLQMPAAAVFGRLHKQILTNLVGQAGNVVAVTTNNAGGIGCLLFDLSNDWY